MPKQNPLPQSRAPHGEPPYQPHKWNKGPRSIKASHNCYTYMLNDLYHVPRRNGKPQPGYFVDKPQRSKKLTCTDVASGVHLDNPHITTLSVKSGRRFRCPSNHYKGFMMVSPDMDYHFARQDNRMIAVFRKMHADKVPIPDDFNTLAHLFIDYSFSVIPAIVSLAQETYPSQMHFSTTPREKLRAIVRCSKTWSHKPGATDATDKDSDKRLILDPLKANWDYSSQGGINYTHMCCFYSIPTNATAHTYSTGIPQLYDGSNNPSNQRTNLGTEVIDTKYQRLVRKACSKTSSQRRQR